MRQCSKRRRKRREGSVNLTSIVWAAGVLLACSLAVVGARLAGAGRGPATVRAPVRASPGAHQPQDRADHGGRAVVKFSVDQSEPGATSRLLPADERIVYGFFRLSPGVRLSEVKAEWWWNGRSIGAPPLEAISGPDAGRIVIRATLSAGGEGRVLGPGLGELEATCRGARVARGSFVTAEQAVEILSQAEPPARQTAVRSMVASRGVDGEGQPSGPTSVFNGQEKVWVVFEYEGADAGAAFVVRWYCDNHELAPARRTVNAPGERGFGHAWIAAGPGKRLPAAEYGATVSYGSEAQVLGQCKFRVVGSEAADSPRRGFRQPRDSSSSSNRSNSSAS